MSGKKNIPSRIKRTIDFYKRDFLFDIMVEKRLFLPVNDISNLSLDIPLSIMPKHELGAANVFYGIAQIIKSYAQVPERYSLKCTYTHMFYGRPWKSDFDSSLPICMVWGDAMRNAFMEYTTKPIFTVGPPICYAQCLYSQKEIADEKKRLGKNALIFPAHSTHYANTIYSPSFLLKKARWLKNDFDSIRFCIYWKDYILGNAKAFLESEFECITAGHIFDPLFLPRLKAIISVADHTFGNALGSHSGLSIGMNVPHSIFYQKLSHSGDIYYAKADEYVRELKKLSELFYEYSSVITAEQKKVVDNYWGFSNVKEPGELRQIFQFAEESYQKNN